ncbi:MAG: hypothetical protein AAGA32_10300 [Pseudomonadota bacterium]
MALEPPLGECFGLPENTDDLDVPQGIAQHPVEAFRCAELPRTARFFGHGGEPIVTGLDHVVHSFNGFEAEFRCI